MSRVAMAAVAALTLGLAPFAPEPHIVGKLRWILGGGEGMSATDYGDLLMHGAPWVWLAFEAVRAATQRLRGRSS